MILVDVDRSYGRDDSTFLPKAAKILKSVGVDWPNTIPPRGFEDTRRQLNVDGYATVVVDQHGIVRAADAMADDVDELVTKIMEEWAAERLAAKEEKR